jgi:lysophospholipid acyltransferase (LPLAT)-like uncharacterized protein
MKKRPSWFDVKTKFKKTIRSIFYTKFGQELICYTIIAYIKIIKLTSRLFVVDDVAMKRFKNSHPVIIVSWHHQLMMSPFVAKQIRKVNKTHKIASLASKHGDGQFAGRIMEKFGVINVAGSSQDKRKTSRGIDIRGLKNIFRALKNQLGIAITPDGPRGPTMKINGEVIKIASLSGVPIIPVAIVYSRFFELNTWDKFQIPLPFGKICYYYGEEFFVAKNIAEDEIPALNLLLEEKINFTIQQANRKIKN